MFSLQAAPDAAETLALCRDIAPGVLPVTVSCAALPGGAELDCFHTVDAAVAQNGGRSVCGWALWLWPRVLIEAEFHAVWQRPDGQWLDVVQRRLPMTHITFLPVAGLRYQGRQVDNIRRPLSQAPAVREYIYLLQRRFQLLNAGPLAAQHGLVTLKGKALKEWDKHEKRLQRLAKTLRTL